MSGDGAPAVFGGLAFGAAAFEAGPLDALAGPEESLALATDPTPGAPQLERAAPPPPTAVSTAQRAPHPREVPAPVAQEDDGREPVPLRPALVAGQRLRAAAVNALALIALLAIALGFRVVLRGEASLGPAALRPSTLLRALGAAPAPAGPFELAGVRTGLYEQTSGGAILFVRGEVVSRAPGPVEAVRVEAELVRGGEVLARGEARAGVVPTPEEVNRATDRAALNELTAAMRKRAPKAVAPGERLGFLVTLGDAPADVSGASVRVHAEADGAPR